MEAIDADLERIVDAARETLLQAGLTPEQIDALYFTGGSTGLRRWWRRRRGGPRGRIVHGDRFASVATGLGWMRGAGSRVRRG